MYTFAVMKTYQQMDYLSYLIKQCRRALDLGDLDDVYISEGGHSALFPPRSEDGSWDYLS